MKCPLCGAWAINKETRSNQTENTTRRRYECGNLHRFSTVERVAPASRQAKVFQKGQV